MINAGVTEGIAWTDEEYVEWGVRLERSCSAATDSLATAAIASNSTAVEC